MQPLPLELEIEPSDSHYDFEEEEEQISRRGLISSSAHGNTVPLPRASPKGPSGTQRKVYAGLVGLVALWCVFKVLEPLQLRDDVIINYKCPATYGNSKMDDALVDERYNKESQLILDDYEGFLKHFKNKQFDQWGKSYREVKKLMYHWKETRYKGVPSGGHIYESACGIGLNLYMTLEILAEAHSITDITVYGNDYAVNSVEVARKILTGAPGDSRRGRICPADSSDLSHVPESVFDLVFTGYIAPLVDPLELGLSQPQDAAAAYFALCDSDAASDVVKRNEAQQKQEDWFASWVSNMVRIAKPGAPVIIEQVSYPLCDARFDWGGVDREWWYVAIDKYHWDVQPKRVDIVTDAIHKKRYHVRLEKNL